MYNFVMRCVHIKVYLDVILSLSKG